MDINVEVDHRDSTRDFSDNGNSDLFACKSFATVCDFAMPFTSELIVTWERSGGKLETKISVRTIARQNEYQDDFFKNQHI